jgi:hypothetical protein
MRRDDGARLDDDVAEHRPSTRFVVEIQLRRHAEARIERVDAFDCA